MDSDHCIKNVQLTGYYPGVIGKAVELHASYYHREWNFDVTFETQVAKELGAFFDDFKDGRDYFRAALTGGGFAGCIAIDGKQPAADCARLRWFIVAPEHQGAGIGGTLIGEAIAFCRSAGHKRIVLYTFEGLRSARTLYGRAGFRLAEEYRAHQWGNDILEQKFELVL